MMPWSRSAAAKLKSAGSWILDSSLQMVRASSSYWRSPRNPSFHSTGIYPKPSSTNVILSPSSAWRWFTLLPNKSNKTMSSSNNQQHEHEILLANDAAAAIARLSALHAHLRTFYDLCVHRTRMNPSVIKGPEWAKKWIDSYNDTVDHHLDVNKKKLPCCYHVRIDSGFLQTVGIRKLQGESYRRFLPVP